MVVRRAVTDDVAAIVDVLVAVAPEGVLGMEPPVDVEAVGQRFRDTITGDGSAVLWVAEHDGAVAGYLGLLPSRVAGVLSVGMALRPQARGRGLGRALLDTAVVQARSARAHKVELEVWTDNARAIALYTTAGFEVEGVRRDHYRRRDGSLRSALIMARRLPGPGSAG